MANHLKQTISAVFRQHKIRGSAVPAESVSSNIFARAVSLSTSVRHETILPHLVSEVQNPDRSEEINYTLIFHTSNSGANTAPFLGIYPPQICACGKILCWLSSLIRLMSGFLISETKWSTIIFEREELSNDAARHQLIMHNRQQFFLKLLGGWIYFQKKKLSFYSKKS